MIIYHTFLFMLIISIKICSINEEELEYKKLYTDKSSWWGRSITDLACGKAGKEVCLKNESDKS